MKLVFYDQHRIHIYKALLILNTNGDLKYVALGRVDCFSTSDRITCLLRHGYPLTVVWFYFQKQSVIDRTRVPFYVLVFYCLRFHFLSNARSYAALLFLQCPYLDGVYTTLHYYAVLYYNVATSCYSFMDCM